MRFQLIDLRTLKAALRLVQTPYEAELNTYLGVLSADGQYHQAMMSG